MTGKFGATGAGGLESHSPCLPEDLRQQIKAEIDSVNNVPKSGFEVFFSELERAVRNCKGNKEWGVASSPGQVRKNLTRIRDDALRLNETFNSLDGNSLQLLGNYAQVSWLRVECVQTIVSAAIQALNDAQDLPVSGRRPEDEKIVLVLEVAEILSSHLNIKFSSTKVSVFSNIMSLVVQAATGKSEVRSISRLLKNARNWQRRVAPDGVVSYDTKNVT